MPDCFSSTKKLHVNSNIFLLKTSKRFLPIQEQHTFDLKSDIYVKTFIFLCCRTHDPQIFISISDIERSLPTNAINSLTDIPPIIQVNNYSKSLCIVTVKFLEDEYSTCIYFCGVQIFAIFAVDVKA